MAVLRLVPQLSETHRKNPAAFCGFLSSFFNTYITVSWVSLELVSSSLFSVSSDQGFDRISSEIELELELGLEEKWSWVR